MDILTKDGLPKYTSMRRGEIGTNTVITGANMDISANIHEFPFTIQPFERWKPLLSEWVVRFSLKANDNATQLVKADDITLSMNAFLNPWQYITFCAGGREIEKCTDVPQISALRTRLEKSKAWFDSVGKSRYWDVSFQERQNIFIADAPNPDQQLLSEEFIIQDLYSNYNIAIGLAGNEITIADVANTESVSLVQFDVGALVGAPALPGNLNAVVNVGDEFTLGPAWNVADEIGIKIRVLSVGANTMNVTPRLGGQAPYSPLALLMFINQKRTVDVNATIGDVNITNVTNSKDRRECCFKTPLGISYTDEMPPGKYAFKMRGYSIQEFGKRLIESRIADKTVGTSTVGGDYRIDIKEFFYQPYIVQSDKRMDDNPNYKKTVKMYELKKKKIKSDSEDLEFTIAGKANAIGFVLQDGRVGSQSLYSSSVFKAYDNIGIVGGLRIDNNLKQYQIKYSGLTIPEVAQEDNIYDPRTNQCTQSWIETYKNSGAYYYEGGMETEAQFLQRGNIWYWQVPRDQNSYATDLTMKLRFQGDVGLHMNCILFYTYYKTFQMEIKNGSIKSVKLGD